MWRTNGMVPSAKFPFLNFMGHTTNHYHECRPTTHLFIHHTKHFWFFFVDVLDKICRTCYHTDPMFGTKTYYGVHASTHPQVHIHQNHRDYPLEISQLMNVENNGLVPSANFPFLHLIGPHTLPITIMGACLWHIPLQGQISALFENEYTSEIANICHFWKQIHLKGQNSAICLEMNTPLKGQNAGIFENFLLMC